MEQTTTVIPLVKYKQWYMPADAQAYQQLVDLGIPSTRIHEDQMEIIKLVAGRRGFVFRAKHFDSVFDAFTDDLHARWMRFPHRNAKFKKTRMVFSTTDAAAFKRAKNKSVPIIERKLREFFQRWGFIGDFKYSENHDKVRLVVEYAFSSNRRPVVQLKEDAKEVTKTILNLGMNRLIFWRDAKYLHWEIEVKAADEWFPRTKGQCLHKEMSDPTATVILLMRSLDETDAKPDLSFDQQLAKAVSERDAAIADAQSARQDLVTTKEQLKAAREQLKEARSQPAPAEAPAVPTTWVAPVAEPARNEAALTDL